MRARIGPAALAVAVFLILAAPESVASPDYRFSPEPGVVKVTNNGTILRAGAVCRQGRCEAIALPDATPNLRDINEQGTIVGQTIWEGGIPVCPYTSGFLIDRRGARRMIGSGLYAISDNGTALGFVSYCITAASLIIRGNNTEFVCQRWPTVCSLASDFLSINDAGWLLAVAYRYQAPSAYVLTDGELFEWLDPPEGSDVIAPRFEYLNNRRQVVGWWEESPILPPGSAYCPWQTCSLSRGLLREPDGELRTIDWDYDWPETIVRVLDYPPEEVTLRLVQRLGTRFHKINGRGDVVATVRAGYQGFLSNGVLVSRIEEMQGIGTPTPVRRPEEAP